VKPLHANDGPELCSPECVIKNMRELIQVRKTGVMPVVDQALENHLRALEIAHSSQPQIINKWTEEEHRERHKHQKSQTGTCKWCLAEGVSPNKRAGYMNAGYTGTASPNSDPCWWCGRVTPTRQGHFMHMHKAHGYERGMTKEQVTGDDDLHADVVLADALLDDGAADDLLAEVAELRRSFNAPGTA